MNEEENLDASTVTITKAIPEPEATEEEIVDDGDTPTTEEVVLEETTALTEEDLSD